jgi:Holliday junction resolvase RusA-like endonuclease
MRGAAFGALLSLRVNGAPAPASRGTQCKNGGFFYSKGHAAFYADCQRQLAEQKPPAPLSGLVMVSVESIVARPKATKLAVPKGDVDNFAKVPLDAATKAKVWGDDYQVVALVSTKRWAKPGEAPGTNLTIIPLG